MAKYMVGCDIGGTFTDVVCIDEDTGKQLQGKALSTPPLYVEGVIDALDKVQFAGREVIIFRHGATISTNAIIQRLGAKTGVLTTKDFEGILYHGNPDREEFDLNKLSAPTVVLTRDVLTARERMGSDGKEVTPLDEDDVRKAARAFKKRGMEAIAICFMDSYLNPSHEQRAEEILKQECPEMFICASCNVLLEMFETERLSTTILNAYLGPVMKRYLLALKKRLGEWGYNGEILITHSGGGVMGAEEAVRLPIRSAHSSPVSGIVGLGRYIGSLAGFENVITFEMGGTTCDVSLIYRKEPITAREWRVIWRHVVKLRSVESVYIGAGGGSIASVDRAGLLRVGPQSAGASPGPACFALGGTEPTNTDSQLVLGRLNPEYFLGGGMSLDPELAQKAVEKIADVYGWTVEEAASSILEIATADLVAASRLMSVVKGYDPRDFALVGYGGAGPMYVVDVAKGLGVSTVIIPPLPGYASAFGSLRVDVKHDLLCSIQKMEGEIDFTRLNKAMDELVAEGKAVLKREGISEQNMLFQRLADVKYFDQTFYLSVDVPGGKIRDLKGITANFLDAMQQRYGYILPPGFVPLEVVNIRVVATGILPKPELKKDSRRGQAEEALKTKRPVYFKDAGGFIETPIYERAILPNGAVIEGPCVIEQPDTTTVITPGTTVSVDDYSNLIVKIR